MRTLKAYFSFLLIVASAVAGLRGEELAVNGMFAGSGKNGLPSGWMPHLYERYRPPASVETAQEPGRKGNVLHVFNIAAPGGTALMTVPRFAAVSGNVVVVSFAAKGRGKAFVRLYQYAAKGGWNPPAPAQSVNLTDQWTEHEASITVGDGSGKATESVSLVLGGEKGADLRFSDVRAHVKRTLRARAFAFRTAKVLACDDFEDADAKRTGSPEVLRAPVSNGLLELTGQGVYRTRDTVNVALPESRFTLPEDAKAFFSAGFRLYGFGSDTRIPARLDLAFSGATNAFTLAVAYEAGSGMLRCSLSDNGRAAGALDVPCSSLPADFSVIAGAEGEFAFSVKSLSDGSGRRVSGDAAFFKARAGMFETVLTFASPEKGREAQLVLDNYRAAYVTEEPPPAMAPAAITPAKEFDPAKAGWKRVFSDDFDGTALDPEKWYVPGWVKHADHAFLDGQGHLVLKADFEPGTTNLVSTSLWSRPAFVYGYFEARVRFTRNNGWWAAFWLFGSSNTNPALDGSEVDIFEDYYTRGRKPQDKPVLDHNLHIYLGNMLKSWNYKSTLSGTLDDFYVIGCKWTPFEISYYVDGKLVSSKAAHSPHASVTFDAFNHSALRAPLHMLFSGCVMKDWGRRDTAGFAFPEFFKVDWARAWAYPEADAATPRVFWKGTDTAVLVPPDSALVFTVGVEPSGVTKAPVKAAYLFDNGTPLACRTEPPYVFNIPFSKEYYLTTRYMKPGRSGALPPWDALMHVFTVYVQDAEGRVGVTAGPVLKIPVPAAASEPFKGQPHAVPGKIDPAAFDAGGRGTAYYSIRPNPRSSNPVRKDVSLGCRPDRVVQLKTGEWMNHTVDVKSTGKYRVSLEYGTGNFFDNKLLFVVDGERRGVFDLAPNPSGKWDTHAAPALDNIVLAAGRHMITLVPIGYFSIGTLELAETGTLSDNAVK